MKTKEDIIGKLVQLYAELDPYDFDSDPDGDTVTGIEELFNINPLAVIDELIDVVNQLLEDNQ